MGHPRDPVGEDAASGPNAFIGVAAARSSGVITMAQYVDLVEALPQA